MNDEYSRIKTEIFKKALSLRFNVYTYWHIFPSQHFCHQIGTMITISKMHHVVAHDTVMKAEDNGSSSSSSSKVIIKNFDFGP
jgi:hypothetical protein